MASCAYCNSTVFFGKRQDGYSFCNATCASKGALVMAADQVPAEIVKQQAAVLHAGQCPRCQGAGPVDVHTSHRVYSVLVMTSWHSRPRISCRPCGIKAKAGDAAFSFFLGWWGVPWGVLVTPMQVGRNLFGMLSSPDPSQPSPQLEAMVRQLLAAQMLEDMQRAKVAA